VSVRSPIRDDVALDLAGAATDRQRSAEQVRPVPQIELFGIGVLESDHAVGSCEVFDERHELLGVHVGLGLANRRDGAGVTTVDLRIDDLVTEAIDDEALAENARRPLASDRVGAGTEAPDLGQTLVGGRAHSPQNAAFAERHAFVPKGDVGQTPAFSFGTDAAVDGDAHVVEKHFVEMVAPGHLGDGPDVDTRGGHVENEVRDALVFGDIGIGAGEQDAPLRMVCPGRPDLLAVHDVLIAVAHRHRSQ